VTITLVEAKEVVTVSRSKQGLRVTTTSHDVRRTHFSRQRFCIFLTLRGLFLEYISTNRMLFTTCHSHGCYSDSVKVVIMLMSRVPRVVCGSSTLLRAFLSEECRGSFACITHQQINMTTTKKGLNVEVSKISRGRRSGIDGRTNSSRASRSKKLNPFGAASHSFQLIPS